MINNIFKLLTKTLLVLLVIITTADSKTYKVKKKFEIELFNTDNLLESKKVLSEGFGLIKINVYAEKNENNEIISIIMIVTTRIDKYGREVKTILDNYLFKDPPSLFKNKANKNFLLIDEKRNNTISVQELNLKEYLNQHDEIPEFKRTITNLKKKYNINFPERVLRSDHVYLKGNGDIVWISHMYDYKKKINDNIFDNNISKFHPNSIDQHPDFKKFMDKWIKLSLSRHNEFQNKLKIKNKLELNYIGFDIGTNLKTFKKEFYDENFSTTKIKVAEQKAKEEKAKKEPSLTQKTVDIYKLIKNTQADLRILEKAIYSSRGDISFETADAMLKSIQNNLKTLNINKNSISYQDKETIRILNLDAKTAKRLIYDGKTLVSDGSKIIKTEQTVTPKKKVKVAKVEEPKKEEFKPENKDIDNDAPVIEISQNIIVSDTSYVVEGKVSDKSDKIFVEIDGQPIEVKKGKFRTKRYSPVDEQIKIVAIDQWGNKSKPKIVNIKINIEETLVAENLEPLNPSNIRTKSSNEKIAIIIGIENYSEAPIANYANLDAQYFFDYARKAFGVEKQNINLLINEDATVVKTDKALSLWLKSKVKKNRSDLIIFFAGHGLASTDGKELYLLPQDGNPDRLERTALSRTDLFKEIIELNPKSVTMFLDTCYSGVSRDEQMLLASARPIRIVADEQDGIPDNFTIFSASKLDQISSGLREAKHGIFSYYLMKGLEGNADFNEDKKITNGELLAYMDANVSQKAAEQGREQNPSLAGDPDKVLISYR